MKRGVRGRRDNRKIERGVEKGKFIYSLKKKNLKFTKKQSISVNIHTLNSFVLYI